MTDVTFTWRHSLYHLHSGVPNFNLAWGLYYTPSPSCSPLIAICLLTLYYQLKVKMPK